MPWLVSVTAALVTYCLWAFEVREVAGTALPFYELSIIPMSMALLRYLLVNQGRVLSKGQILDHVWKYDFGGDGGVVETYIGYLRRKVDHVEPKLIHTIRGIGYTLRRQ